MKDDAIKGRVLYVESSDLIQSWVRPLLNRLGCLLEPARTIDAARAIVENEDHLDLVVIGDLTRPTDLVAGVPLAELSLINSIRERKCYRETPVIIFTNVDWLDDAYRAGADGEIAKPAGADDLEKVIKPYLDGKKKRRRHAAAPSSSRP